MHNVFIPSDVWVDNLAHEQDVSCGGSSYDDHKWPVKLQDRNEGEGQTCEADACSSWSCGSGLVHIQSSLMHNLQSMERKWDDG